MRRRVLLLALMTGAVLAPGAVRAQQPGKVYRLAHCRPAADEGSWYDALLAEMARLGFVEGKNLVMERHSGEGQRDRYAELAQTVVRTKPDAIFAVGEDLVRAFKAATTTIPILAWSADPVAYGFVASHAHPGSNITGVSVEAGFGLHAKQLQILREISPTASRIAVLGARGYLEQLINEPMREAAKQAGVSLVPAETDNPNQEPQYRSVFAAMVRDRIEAMIVGDSPINSSQGLLIIELASRSQLPAIYPGRGYVKGGGLISYFTDFDDLARHAAATVVAIFKGASPGDIPIYRADHYELVINTKTATALGLTIPPLLLARADEVIE